MNYRLVLLACCLSITSIINTDQVSKSPDPLAEFDKSVYEWTKPLTEALHAVRTKYYKNIDPKDPLIKAAKAFINALDPHSDFVDPQEFKSIQETTQGEFFGIGIAVDNSKKPEQEYLIIADIIAGGPAEKAGLRKDDKIVEVDDVSVRGLTVNEIIGKIKGEKGKKVHLKIQRNTSAELLPFDIVRDVVKDQNALCFYFKDLNIFYLSLNMFTENSTNQVEELLKKCQTSKAKGLIIDLRNNAGGLLTAAIDIAGIFLDEGSLVVTTKNRDQTVLEKYTTKRKPLGITNIPIFIIVNNFTASAGEILPGSLRAHAEMKNNNSPKQIFIVGSTTFGKGSVQEVIPTCNDCAIKLTTALYYLPDDTSLQGIGIKPDFTITPRFAPTKDMIWFNKFFGQESALKNAIEFDEAATQENTNNKKDKPKEPEKPKTPQEKRQEQIGSDYLILSTVRLISMFDMAKRVFPEQTKTRQESIKLLKSLYNPDDTIVMEEIQCSN
jgi:carboxyl-terminal processing protease